MEREVSLEEISDGKLYELNDMVKADCRDCQGCSACCHAMGSSIVLDPCDLYRMVTGLKRSFESLLDHEIELNVVDGLILPNLKMSGEQEHCSFLNEQGRCSIHAHRPGICRLFPLGRIYGEHSFTYFLQVHECRKDNRTKVKVRKWIDTPDLKHYEAFVTDWHYFLKDIQKIIRAAEDTEMVKTWSMYILKTFYMRGYEEERSFYEQFYEALEQAEKYLSGLTAGEQ